MSGCLLSVIVPIYQVEAYLPRCLDSIIAQTFRDFELILVNDGSTDRCPEIMREYAEKDERIVLIHKENGGLSSARNAGMDAAHGRYICFIDSDDCIADSLFANMLTSAEDNRADLVVWNYSRVNDEGQGDPNFQMKDEIVALDQLGLDNYFYDYFFPYRHGHEVCNKLFRRDILEKHRLRFQPTSEILAEDLMFTFMYLLHIQKIVSLSKPYYFYYVRNGSITNSLRPRAAHRMITLAVRLADYVCQVGRWEELKHVLPVLAYLTLITKGISLDPDMEEICSAMAEYGTDERVRSLLKDLIKPLPLTLYSLKTKRGLFIHIRARLFAWRWLRGDVHGAVALVQRHADNG